MCGRYAFFQRPAEVRRQLEQNSMPSTEAPEDDEVRQTYNFAPGSFGLVYRADVPYTGASTGSESKTENDGEDAQVEKASEDVTAETKPEETYKLQAMKWGLIPFFTKRNPDYGSMLKTINCRDDSLLENRGIWNVPKMKKRCVIVCQGFYEWLKKDGSKHKVPHFVKRKDGLLMCFAGLWDCVQYEGSDEKHFTYTIITTSSNKQLKFLHDRMPVILDNGSDDLFTWLDPKRNVWTKELQSLLRPYEGELECYPVSGEVGKVGNNSSKFIVPVDSAENKSNIANFFGNQKKLASKDPKPTGMTAQEPKVKHEPDEDRKTVWTKGSTEDNAPLPVPSEGESVSGSKRSRSEMTSDNDDNLVDTPEEAPESKSLKVAPSFTGTDTVSSPTKSSRKTRSATSNAKASPTKPSKPKATETGSQKITEFFGK